MNDTPVLIEDPEFFFVYGTLRPGEIRWPVLEHAIEGDPVPAQLHDAAMFNVGSFPMIVSGPEFAGSIVVGELVKIQTDLMRRMTQRLDGIEGYLPSSPANSLYIRQIVTVTPTAKGAEPVNAWVYFAGKRLAEDVNMMERISSGDWKRRPFSFNP